MTQLRLNGTCRSLAELVASAKEAEPRTRVVMAYTASIERRQQEKCVLDVLGAEVVSALVDAGYSLGVARGAMVIRHTRPVPGDSSVPLGSIELTLRHDKRYEVRVDLGAEVWLRHAVDLPLLRDAVLVGVARIESVRAELARLAEENERAGRMKRLDTTA